MCQYLWLTFVYWQHLYIFCSSKFIYFSIIGYLPQNLYSLSSSYGSEHLLKALLQKLKQHKVRAMADVVINHRVGTSRGNGGMYNRYDGIPLSWDERAVTSCTGGLVTKFQLVCFFCRHVHKSTNLLKSHYFVICYC